ncbi:hypothetical protein ACUSIJ_28385 [Pseudochelatococcus sp. B33]
MSLRDLGCAVVVWTPDEIGDADRDQLESIMIERGSIYLESAES